MDKVPNELNPLKFYPQRKLRIMQYSVNPYTTINTPYIGLAVKNRTF